MARRWTVVQLIPAMNAGGAERSTLEVARALVAAGHRSIVISAGGRWQSRLRQEGSEHITLPLGDKSLKALWVAWRLRRLLKQLRPDLVHVRSRLPAWIARLAMLGIGLPIARVSTVHGLNSVSAYSRILTLADRVIAVSQTTRNHLLKYYPGLKTERVRVIPRGVERREFSAEGAVDTHWREAFADEFPALVGGKLLTLPGRGTRLKGHAEAIELLAALRERGIDARLLLLGVIEHGREDYRRELTRLAQRLGVQDYLVCARARTDIRDVYAISDLVLQLSTRPESFGRVVVEALALGRPVLGYDHGGVGELLAEHYPEGRVALRDHTGLIERAQALLSHPPKVRATDLPTTAHLQQRTLAVYAELIEGLAPDAYLPPAAGEHLAHEETATPDPENALDSDFGDEAVQRPFESRR